MVLALIDLQRIFAEPDSGWATPDFQRVVKPAQDLVELFSPRVVFTRFVAPAGEPTGSWVPYYEQWPFALQPPDSYAYQLVDEFRGAPTLDKPTFGKWGQELAEAAGPERRLVLAGVTTECCVLTTALAAVDAGAHVQVVEDACAGVDEQAHRQAIDIMRLYAPMLEIVTVDELRSRGAGR
ncbi:isochorismatase hydrolase [Kribbella flavida DSM 17836]|uniref:Isochorismatase hydrolase n=1 Tax=Kribbella flavida (strain DSM 17836 / JCM 10339 / NBRC 14399) TaxID=479435 RepID=D2PVL2_KRIFD|nr:cysteine hydrolase [Kribbella flavida]ADB35252.1 isochorismatase hydrolase [Kribbella flavida DSM 17836]